MLKDYSNNEIIMAEQPNGHLLVMGASGTGKSYFLCRRLEELIQQGRKVIVIDFSGSYTYEELAKNKFRGMKFTSILNPYVQNMTWTSGIREFAYELTESLLAAFNIQSFYQRELLLEAINMRCRYGVDISFAGLYDDLKKMLDIKSAEEEKKNLVHLLNKFQPFTRIDKIEMSANPAYIATIGSRPITILQLSEFPESLRNVLAELFVNLVQKEAYYGHGRVDTIVLDEFQNLQMGNNSVVSCILREGRKFGLSAILSSQFLNSYDKGIVEALQQAANKLFFRPTERELREVASWVAPLNRHQWVNIINRLNVGQAVLTGKYFVNSGTRICDAPIICQIE